MNPGLAAIGVAVVAGSVIAVSAREPRVAILGLVLALIGTPLIASPPAGLLPLAARLVAAILAGFLLWVAVRGVEARTLGSRVGWPVESIVAAAAAAAGLASAGLGAPAVGAPEAQAVGFALGALAIAPLATRRDALQHAIGLGLLVSGALLVRTTIGGTPGPLEQLVAAGLVVGIGGAGALLVGATVEGSGSFAVRDGRGAAAHRIELDEAHPR